MQIKILGKDEAGIKVNNVELNDLIECVNSGIAQTEHLINMSDPELQTNINLSGGTGQAIPVRKDLIQFKQRLDCYLSAFKSLYENEKE